MIIMISTQETRATLGAGITIRTIRPGPTTIGTGSGTTIMTMTIIGTGTTPSTLVGIQVGMVGMVGTPTAAGPAGTTTTTTPTAAGTTTTTAVGISSTGDAGDGNGGRLRKILQYQETRAPQ